MKSISLLRKRPDISFFSSFDAALSKYQSVAAHQIHHIPKAQCEFFFFSPENSWLHQVSLAPAHIKIEMPESGTRTPDLPPPPQLLRPKFPSHPPLEAGICWGLGQVVDAAMKEDLNPATRPEGRREEVDEWQGWRRRRYVGGHKTSKTTTITARKQTTRRKKNKREKGEGSKRSSEAPKVL